MLNLAEQQQYEQVRSLSSVQRAARFLQFQQWGRKVSYDGIATRFPNQVLEKLKRAWIPGCPAEFEILGTMDDYLVSAQSALERVDDVLTSLNLQYFITGGFAVCLYAMPRMTRDIDLVVKVDSDRLPELKSALEAAQFYCSEPTTHIGSSDPMFNAIDQLSSYKADIMAQPDPPELQRVQSLPVGERIYQVESPEDLILFKLKKSQGEDRHFNDCVEIIRTQAELLDMSYLEAMAMQNGLTIKLQQANTENEY